ncbi:hypothetical protein ACIQ6V_08710 [Streptomyces sp. NPDC096198]|uniref:hypothetical protein n=1 Tax=Streptomyces sp. NPDC096198 TaxID=3366080 RepID=UPI0038220C74
MSKLVSLSEESHDFDWFATGGLFAWVADFLMARVEDPEVREEMRRDALSGYLYVGDLPEAARAQALRALREELIPAVDEELYPRPLGEDALFAARVKTLAVLAWELARRTARDPSAPVVVVADGYEWTVRHGLHAWLVAFLRDGTAHPEVREQLTEILDGRRPGLDLRALAEPGRSEVLRMLAEDAVAAAQRNTEAVLDCAPESARWAVGDVRILALMAGEVADRTQV